MDIQDRFQQQDGQVFLTGMEAIIRLVLEKQRLDQASGHVNQTYFTGYEGSPLGGLDLKLVEQLETLNRQGRTVHQFGINEKTAASAGGGDSPSQTKDLDHLASCDSETNTQVPETSTSSDAASDATTPRAQPPTALNNEIAT